MVAFWRKTFNQAFTQLGMGKRVESMNRLFLKSIALAQIDVICAKLIILNINLQQSKSTYLATILAIFG